MKEKLEKLEIAQKNILLVNELLIHSYIAFFQAISDVGIEQFKQYCIPTELNK